jgi:hypothetical protein
MSKIYRSANGAATGSFEQLNLICLPDNQNYFDKPLDLPNF